MITTEERIAMVEQYPNLLILKTCKLFAILFDDEQISLFIKKILILKYTS